MSFTKLYEDNEAAFLQDMVIRFGFSGNTELAFVQRLLLSNKDLDEWEPLADVLKDDLLRGARSEDADWVKLLKDRWDKAICPKLEKEFQCNFSRQGKWKQVRQKLYEVVFPKWAKEQGLIKPLTIEECWKELKTKAENSQSTTDKEKQSELIVEKWEPQLADMGARRNIKRQQFPANSDLTYRVISPQSGHLMLFEREPNGTIICLCPSEFAPSSYHAGKETVLPHPDSEYESFGSDELGWEQLLAVITPELPPFQWLEDSRQEALEVNQDHLAGLLDYMNSQPNTEVLYTEYLVVNA
jgi:Domain of unknown function (DUF4384)